MKCDELKPLVFSIADLAYVDEVHVTKNFQNPHDHAVYKATEVDEAIAELKQKLDEYILVKLSTQQMLKNLLDCGLIKAWHFNGKFNVVLKADDPHLQIAELKAENERLKKCEIWMKQHFFCEEVIACESAKNRKLRRALWLTRANRALEKIAWFKLWNASISTMNPEDGARQEFDKWKKALGKFLKKAEEYR